MSFYHFTTEEKKMGVEGRGGGGGNWFSDQTWEIIVETNFMLLTKPQLSHFTSSKALTLREGT